MVGTGALAGALFWTAMGAASGQDVLPQITDAVDGTLHRSVRLITSETRVATAAASDAQSQETTTTIIPDSIVFGAGIDEITRRVYPHCEAMAIRVSDPPGIDTSRSSHVSIDCDGYLYRGSSRTMELVFGDNQLDIAWIELLPGEAEALAAEVEALHGPPSHKQTTLTAFLNAGICIIASQSKLLLLSERMKEPYHMFFSEQPSI